MNKLAMLMCLMMCSCTVVEPYILRCYEMVGWQSDNAVEEIAEAVIKQETGMDVDLTPSSKE